MIKKAINAFARKLGYEIKRVRNTLPPSIPDGHLYQPLFSPWLGEGDFKKYFDIAAQKTLVSRDRCYVLYILLQQCALVEGDVWECGVYKGGTAAMIISLLTKHAPEKRLYLFDTFEGMPETDIAKDLHQKGDFADTSLEAVLENVGYSDRCVARKGVIPETFLGLERSIISFAHIDVDIYRSIMDSLSFIWPRLSKGGVIVFDDYGFSSCPGARVAVDEFFGDTHSVPLCLPTGQALVFKSID